MVTLLLVFRKQLKADPKFSDERCRGVDSLLSCTHRLESHADRSGPGVCLPRCDAVVHVRYLATLR